MTTYAFVFARGGSKGLPRKNIKLLAGKPLIQYSIDVARQVPGIKQVFVSTEDKEIAAIAEQGGAEIIWRPEELASDTSPEWLSWRHAIEHVTRKYGAFETFISLPATSPLRNADDVGNALSKLQQTGADICISVTAANRSPYFNMVKFDTEGFCSLVITPENGVFRRQDAPEVFDITTVAYAAKTGFVLNQYGLFSGKVVAVEVPKVRAVDIDDIYDFRFAEVLINESLDK
jgi:N-acylneuraminate cytidylyltransferase